MSRVPLPFAVDDMAAFARSLRGQLAGLKAVPGHLGLLNMLARAAGYKNFQHFRAVAASEAACPLSVLSPEPAPPDARRLRRLFRHFDALGRFVRWPSKYGEQQVCLWVLWAGVPPRLVFSESEINRQLCAGHLFGDPALLRRELCDQGLMTRTPDCREYRRVERRPPPLALALIRELRERAASAKAPFGAAGADATQAAGRAF